MLVGIKNSDIFTYFKLYKFEKYTLIRVVSEVFRKRLLFETKRMAVKH